MSNFGAHPTHRDVQADRVSHESHVVHLHLELGPAEGGVDGEDVGEDLARDLEEVGLAQAVGLEVGLAAAGPAHLPVLGEELREVEVAVVGVGDVLVLLRGGGVRVPEAEQ